MLKLSLLSRLGSLRVISIAGSILTPIIDHRLVPYPYMMTFVTTRRCNSRCKMCNIWRDKTSPFLSLDQIDHIFRRNNFSFVRILTLTGGEPSLRPDLPEVLKIIGTYCPNLELIQLATNGLRPAYILEQVRQMLNWVEAELKSVYRFDVQVSLDGIGEIHDWVRGVPGSFQRVLETLERLIALKSDFPKLGIRLSTVVVPHNLPYLEVLQAFASERGLPISFSPVILSREYYSNLQNRDALSFPADQDVQVANFFNRLSQQEQSNLRYYYKDIGYMLLGRTRQRQCMMGFYGFVLEHDGNIYPCVNCENHSFGNLLHIPFEEAWFGAHATSVRQQLRQECCPMCSSLCYPLPVNLLEVIDLWWRQKVIPRVIRHTNLESAVRII